MINHKINKLLERLQEDIGILTHLYKRKFINRTNSIRRRKIQRYCKNKSIFFLSLFTLFAINSCSSYQQLEKKYSIDIYISFNDLPKNVQTVYDSAMTVKNNQPDFFVTDPSIKATLFEVNADSPNIFKPYGYYFNINGRKYFLNWGLPTAKGLPFVIDKRYIYYSLTVNLKDHNYKTAKYIGMCYDPRVNGK